MGCGNMGKSHARAYHKHDNCKITGLVSRGDSKEKLNEEFGNAYPLFNSFDKALAEASPDIVCISSYTETHKEYSIKSLKNGAHVFVEKPLAATVEDAEEILQAAAESGKKLIVGYILRVHPAWKQFIELAKDMQPPYVMRMNLNQQSFGSKWEVHKNLMKTTSPIVDCGVHYVDIMCQITGVKPVSVSALGARLTDEIAEDMYNYGHLLVKYEDGSMGWYESGWGPMVSETAYFVKDITGKRGSVSMVEKEGGSANVEEHTNTQLIKIHLGECDRDGNFVHEDEIIAHDAEPGHDDLCEMEQFYLIDAIENDRDLSGHQKAAIDSLAIVLAADESIKTGKTVNIS